MANEAVTLHSDMVWYVPDLKNNILSIGQLLEKGCLVFMKY